MIALTEQNRRTVEIAIGKKLSAVMAQRGVPYADLAEGLGITEMKVARIINGTTSIDAAQLYWAAKLLDVPLSALCPQ